MACGGGDWGTVEPTVRQPQRVAQARRQVARHLGQIGRQVLPVAAVGERLLQRQRLHAARGRQGPPDDGETVADERREAEHAAEPEPAAGAPPAAQGHRRQHRRQQHGARRQPRRQAQAEQEAEPADPRRGGHGAVDREGQQQRVEHVLLQRREAEQHRHVREPGDAGEVAGDLVGDEPARDAAQHERGPHVEAVTRQQRHPQEGLAVRARPGQQREPRGVGRLHAEHGVLTVEGQHATVLPGPIRGQQVVEGVVLQRHREFTHVGAEAAHRRRDEHGQRRHGEATALQAARGHGPRATSNRLRRARARPRSPGRLARRRRSVAAGPARPRRAHRRAAAPPRGARRRCSPAPA